MKSKQVCGAAQWQFLRLSVVNSTCTSEDEPLESLEKNTQQKSMSKWLEDYPKLTTAQSFFEKHPCLNKPFWKSQLDSQRESSQSLLIPLLESKNLLISPSFTNNLFRGSKSTQSHLMFGFHVEIVLCLFFVRLRLLSLAFSAIARPKRKKKSHPQETSSWICTT